jgi:flagellar basal body-associated protein FliL
MLSNMDKEHTAPKDNKLLYIILIIAVLSLSAGVAGLFVRGQHSEQPASGGQRLPSYSSSGGPNGTVTPQTTPDSANPGGNVYRN